MTQLNVPTVELVSTLRAAPFNGNASSQDYNDSWTESLADLASITGFINDIIIPMLNGLSSTIQPTLTAVPNGLEGRFIFSDTTDTSQIFFDALDNQPNTIADSFRVINGIIQAVQTTIGNLNVEVTALQAALSSTSQNDIAQALQNFAADLESLTAQVAANTAAIAAISITFLHGGVANAVQSLLDIRGGTGITVTNTPASGILTIASTLTLPLFETETVHNSTQTLLNLHGGADISLVESGGTVTIAYTGAAGALQLETNTTPNSTQALLNLADGLGVHASETAGTVTIGLLNPPFDVPIFAPGLGSNNQKLLRIQIARNVTFPAGATGSYATASAPAAATATFSFYQNGATGAFATATFPPSGTTGAFTQGSDAIFAPGDLLEVDGPAAADTTLADVGITLYGYRTS
jgi:hypothetical protein